jgi:hypothetical protein
MIDNRLRIEKQILLGRQAVRNVYKSKSGSVSQEPEPRQLLHSTKAENDHTTVNPVEPPSDPEMPLSVDTDTEAAFARRSPLLKRSLASKNVGSSRGGERGSTSVRRLARVSERKPLPKADEQHVANISASPKVSNSDAHSSGFFARLRANSLSKLPLPFSYDRSRQLQPAGNHQDALNSSDSSSEGDYSWDGGQILES